MLRTLNALYNIYFLYIFYKKYHKIQGKVSCSEAGKQADKIKSTEQNKLKLGLTLSLIHSIIIQMDSCLFLTLEIFYSHSTICSLTIFWKSNYAHWTFPYFIKLQPQISIITKEQNIVTHTCSVKGRGDMGFISATAKMFLQGFDLEGLDIFVKQVCTTFCLSDL